MSAPVTHPGPRYEALLQLLRTAEALWESSRVFFTRWNLSPSQFNILNLLPAPPEGLSQTDLSRALIMHRSNVTGLVDRLEQRGLVARHANAEDRRAYWVVLTPAGAQLLAEILPHYHAAAEEVWGDLPVERANQLATELGIVTGNASRIAGQSAPAEDASEPPPLPAKTRRTVRPRKPRTSHTEEIIRPAVAIGPEETADSGELPVTLL